MKKSLIMALVVVTTLAFAGSALAAGMCSWDFPEPIKPPCEDKVLCKGKAKGAQKLGGCGAPSITWEAQWLTIEKCPD